MTQEFKIPDPTFPIVNRVWTDPPFPTPEDSRALRDQPPLTYALDELHPLLEESGTKIIRMFLMPGQGVEVYCLTPAGKEGGHACSRHTIPWSQVRDAEELMDPETFLEELADSEAAEDGPQPRPHANGAVAS